LGAKKKEKKGTSTNRSGEKKHTCKQGGLVGKKDASHEKENPEVWRSPRKDTKKKKKKKARLQKKLKTVARKGKKTKAKQGRRLCVK